MSTVLPIVIVFAILFVAMGIVVKMPEKKLD